MPNRWDGNPNPGSAFHELIVLPTLAPDLARPYQVPGTVAITPDAVTAVPAQTQSCGMYHALVRLMSAKISQ
jgi:hypothetical protein